jgi:hypothetical protein
MTVGQDIGLGKLLQSAGARRLDNPHVRNIMRCQSVKLQFQMTPVFRSIMAMEYLGRNRPLPCPLLVNGFLPTKEPGRLWTNDRSHCLDPMDPYLREPIVLSKGRSLVSPTQPSNHPSSLQCPLFNFIITRTSCILITLLKSTCPLPSINAGACLSTDLSTNSRPCVYRTAQGPEYNRGARGQLVVVDCP